MKASSLSCVQYNGGSLSFLLVIIIIKEPHLCNSWLDEYKRNSSLSPVRQNDAFYSKSGCWDSYYPLTYINNKNNIMKSSASVGHHSCNASGGVIPSAISGWPLSSYQNCCRNHRRNIFLTYNCSTVLVRYYGTTITIRPPLSSQLTVLR